MTVTNVNVIAKGVGISGNDEGIKLWVIDSASKAAQGDTITIVNATTVISALLTIDSTGVLEPVTISGNVITLLSATGSTHVSGVIAYK